MGTKRAFWRIHGIEVHGLPHCNGRATNVPVNLCRHCRSMSSDTHALNGLEFRNFDDIQREIRKWRKDGESLESVKAVFEVLHTLGPLPKWINPRHLTPHFANQFAHLNPNYVAMMYFWACKLNVDDDVFMEAAGKALMAQGIHKLDNRSLVLAIYGTALLGPGNSIEPLSSRTPGHSSMEQFPSSNSLVDGLAQELVDPKRIDQLHRQELANSLYGLGWLGYNDSNVVEQLLKRFISVGSLDELSEQELVNSLHGIYLLGFKGHSVVPSMVSESLKEDRITKYTAKEIAAVVHTLSNMEYKQGYELEGITSLLEECATSKRRSQYSDLHLSNLICSVAELRSKSVKMDDEVLRILLEEVLSSERRKALSGENLAGIMYAVATSGFQEDSTIGKLVDEIGHRDRLAIYTAKDSSAIICGLGQMDIREGPLLEKITQHLSNPVILQEITDKQILNVMMSLSNLDFRHPELVAPLIERALQCGGGLSGMNPNMLSQFALCIGKLGAGLNSDTELILKRAVSQPLDVLSNESLIMLLHGLGDLGPSAADLVTPVIEEVVRHERLQSLEPRDVALAVYTLGQIRSGEARIMDQLLWEFTKAGVLQNASNTTLSNVMYGLGQLRHVPSEGVIVLLENELARDTRTEAYLFHEIVSIVHSLGLLRLEKRGRVAVVADTLAKLAVEPDRLLQGTNVELACLLYGLCHLRYKNPVVLEPLMSKLVEENRLAQFSNKDVCNILYAIGQMGFSHKEHVKPLVDEAKQTGRIARYSAVQVATLIYSFGKLRYHDQKSLGVFASEILRSTRLGALKAQDLVNVLYGLVFTRTGMGTAVPQILDEIGRGERRTDFIGSEILTITKCLCNLRVNAPSRRVETLLETFIYEMCRVNRLKEYDPRQLSQVTVTLADAKNRDPALVLQVLKEMTKGQAAREMSLVDLAKVVWSIGPTAQVNKEERPYIVVMTRALIHIVLNRIGGIEDMPAVHLAEMLIGMGCMGLRDSKIIDSMVEEIVKHEKLEFYRPWHLCKIFRALGQLQSHNRYGLRRLSEEISSPENLEKMQSEQWSELMSGIVMLGNFKNENLFKIVASQIRVGNKQPLIKMEGVRSTARR